MRLPHIGEVIAGRYRVDGLLGEGTHGAVFDSLDLGAGRPVAVKVFKSDEGDGYAARTRARFDREVQMVSRLRSPSTVSLFDYGESESGALYLVFERVGGEDLSALLARVGTLPVDAALHVFVQILESLAEAHGAGLLHRDIKPSNVRVFAYMDDPLQVKVLDFGLARATDGGHPSVTRTGELIGSPRYMAPEQLMGEKLGPETDLYCAGLLLWELIAGAGALASDSIGERIERLRTATVLEPARLATFDPRLAGFLLRLTAPNRADRFPTAMSAIAAVPDLRIPAPTESAVVRQRPAAAPQQFNRRIAVIVGALAAAVGIAAIVYVASTDVETPASVRTVKPTVRASPLAAVSVDQPDPEPEVTVEVENPCQKPYLFVGDGYVIDDQIVTRERYPAYIPKGLDSSKPQPLILMFHEQGQNGAKLLDYGGFKPIADREGIILVSPTEDDFDSWDPPQQHAERVEHIYNTVLESLCIDRSRIYLVGHAAGASVAHQHACKHPVTALATNRFVRRPDQDLCMPAKATPYMMFYPKMSNYEPFEGGESCTGSKREAAKALAARWESRHNCGRPKRDKIQGGECFEYKCDTPFKVCHIDAGRGWPGIELPSFEYRLRDCGGPQPDHKLPMAELMWEFFDAATPK